jgi:hypothetical protein
VRVGTRCYSGSIMQRIHLGVERRRKLTELGCTRWRAPVEGSSRWLAGGAVEESARAASETCGTPIELGEVLVGPEADRSGLATGSATGGRMAKRGQRLRGFLWRTLLRLTADGNSARRCPTAAAEVACDGGDGSGVGQGEENGRKKRGLGSACWCRGGRGGGVWALRLGGEAGWWGPSRSRTHAW